MCNCNKKRAAYGADNETTRNQRGMVKVKLVGGDPIALSGNITGRTYIFRKLNDVQLVDKRDAKQLEKINGLQFLG
ncbi:MAG: hypothetical protein JNM88_14630 [Chitinophagaceae bacterium]|nr:hypothetical protein [Chitinophagaceae bacterium]